MPRIVRRVLDGRVRRLSAYGPSRHRKPHESQCAACRRVSWFRLLRTILGATYRWERPFRRVLQQLVD